MNNIFSVDTITSLISSTLVYTGVKMYKKQAINISDIAVFGAISAASDAFLRPMIREQIAKSMPSGDDYDDGDMPTS